MTTDERNHHVLAWGCIADDVTGATDLAGNFVARGYSTIVLFGLDALRASSTPESRLADVDVVVVALKSRTAPVDQAVSESLSALRFLEGAGAERIYVKYCSTFDSTPRGNIGPVIDAVLDATHETFTIAVPSFPDTGRTVYNGHLFVGGDLLSESSMRFHPLTPMTDSSVPRLLDPQTRNRVESVRLDEVRAGAGALSARFGELSSGTPGTIAVVDAVTDDDLATISTAASGLRIVTGGSGLALGLAPSGRSDAHSITVAHGHRAILCGSASLRTREQIARARSGGVPWRKLDLDEVRTDPNGTVARTIEWARSSWLDDPGSTPLVYSVDELGDIAGADAGFDAAAAIEDVIGAIADGLVDAGARQIIVAGGETSGRVIAQLGVQALAIGAPIAPGVSWSEARTHRGAIVDLALKSGNFGDPDMFLTAWHALDAANEGGRA